MAPWADGARGAAAESQSIALLAAGAAPRRLPSARERSRNGGQALKTATVTLNTSAASCVVRQGGCRGALRRCPQGGHPPPGAGSPRAGEQACAPIASPPGLAPWIHPTSSCKARKGAGCGDALAPKALLLEPERLRREGADRVSGAARWPGCGGRGDRSQPPASRPRLPVNGPPTPPPPAPHQPICFKGCQS